jgi:hypothetical protein
MRPNRSNNRTESFEQWRQRILDETGSFIEWGLQHPEQVEWIPTHRADRGAFSERVKKVFWSLVLQNPNLPD